MVDTSLITDLNLKMQRIEQLEKEHMPRHPLIINYLLKARGICIYRLEHNLYMLTRSVLEYPEIATPVNILLADDLLVHPDAFGALLTDKSSCKNQILNWPKSSDRKKLFEQLLHDLAPDDPYRSIIESRFNSIKGTKTMGTSK